MLKLFNNNQPYQFILLLVYATALNAVLFFYPSAFQLPEATAPLTRWLFKLLNGNTHLIAILSVSLVFCQALMLTLLLNRIKLFAKVTFIPGILYILVASMFKDFLFLSPAMIANTFIILVLFQLFSMYKQQYAYTEVFDTGLLIGISSLIYFPSVIMLLVIFISLSLLRPFIWREWIVGFLGVVTTYFLAITYYFWFDKLPYFIEHQFGSAFYGFNTTIHIGTDVQVIGMVLLAMIAGTFVIFQNNYLKSPIQIRKYLIIIIWMLVLLLVSFLLEYKLTLRHFVIISVPLSVVLGFYLTNIKNKKLAEAMYWMLLLSVVFFQYYPFIKK